MKDYSPKALVARFKASSHYADFVQDAAPINIVAFVQEDAKGSNGLLLDSTVRGRVDLILNELTAIPTYEVTHIQVFDTSYQIQVSGDDFETHQAYSANVFINAEFCIQVSGDRFEAHKPTFPPSDACYATTVEAQEHASEHYDIDDIEEQIELAGFENNYDYLMEHGETL